MRYRIFYFFSACGTSFGGSEYANGKTPEIAVEHLRKRHPNKTLRITTVRDDNGRNYVLSEQKGEGMSAARKQFDVGFGLTLIILFAAMFIIGFGFGVMVGQSLRQVFR